MSATAPSMWMIGVEAVPFPELDTIRSVRRVISSFIIACIINIHSVWSLVVFFKSLHEVFQSLEHERSAFIMERV